MKILFMDIETSPNTAHVWGLYQQNVGLNQLMESSRVMCWAAGWYGQDEIMFNSEHRTNHLAMVKELHGLLDTADCVVSYNGKKFDIPTANKEFLLAGFSPPSPYKQVDLLKVARSQFRFASNKLAYVANALGLGGKTPHEGHELWVKCMNGDDDAWKKMEEYNIQDVVLLEQLYKALLPWIKTHPSFSLIKDGVVCPNCGSSKKQKRGFNRTSIGIYQRYQCTACYNWFQAGRTQQAKPMDERSKNI